MGCQPAPVEPVGCCPSARGRPPGLAIWPLHPTAQRSATKRETWGSGRARAWPGPQGQTYREYSSFLPLTLLNLDKTTGLWRGGQFCRMEPTMATDKDASASRPSSGGRDSGRFLHFIAVSDSTFSPVEIISALAASHRPSAKVNLDLETPAAHWAIPSFQKPFT